MMVQILKLAESSPDFEADNSKVLASIADDIKKIDAILSANHDKISALI